MKNTKVLSLFLLLASTQTYSYANPELALVLAYDTLSVLNDAISSDNDDIEALKLLQVMNDSISFDADKKKDLANAKNSYLYKGVPLDRAKIEAENKELDLKADNLDQNIKKYEKGGVVKWEKKKVDNRRDERNKIRDAIKNNLAAIQANDAAMASAEGKAAAVQGLISKNQLTFEQALESYIASFGQCYAKAGSVYGSSTVISSKYSKNMPITPKEYAQLVKTLNTAYSQFGSAIMITLDLADSDKDQEASIKDVAGFVGNMAPSSTSYASYAAYGLAAAAATAAAVGAGIVAYNLYQGGDKAWNDTSDAMAAYNSGLASASNLYGQAANSQAGQYAQSVYNSAVAGALNAYTAGMNYVVGNQTSAQDKQEADYAAKEKENPVDTVPVDTGKVSTGTVDTGKVDTGTVDTGKVDTGTVDTGKVDTGNYEVYFKSN